jgi:uncharacterized alkaline shock family protein YloU
LLVAALSLAAIFFAGGIFPLEPALGQIALLYGRWEAIAAAAVFFAISLRLLVAGTGGGPRELIVRIDDEGTVRISMAAVRKFIEKSAAQVRGVHNVKARVAARSGDLRVKMTAGVLPEVNVPEISELMRKKVMISVKETVGREVSEVDILFDTISYDAKEK